MSYRVSLRRIPAVLSVVVMAMAHHTARPDLDSSSVRPVVPGKLLLRAQSRIEVEPKSGLFDAVVRDQEWDVSETAIIVCDMWNDFYCKRAALRFERMVPRLNATLNDARDLGVMVIHAPSGVVDFYREMPQRKRMLLNAPAASSNTLGWYHRDPAREPELPLDVSKQTCDDPVIAPSVRVFSQQHPGIDIIGFDGISDSGQEIYNFCQQEGIKNLVIMGVHTNYCIVNRSFGIRQMVRVGMNVVLARDLTDALYDPRQSPNVSHARGTEIVVEHIEQYLSPSILSTDLTHVAPGSDGPVGKEPAENAKVRPVSDN